MKKFSATLILMGLFLGCASIREKYLTPVEEREKKAYLEKQNNDLLEIEKLVSQRENEKALERLPAFRKAYPATHLFQASRLIEARAYFGLGDFNQAISIYDEINNLGQDRNPEIWAQARYESTFSYEALGDQLKSLTILMGLEKSKAPLRPEVVMAELPARLAAIFSEQGQESEAKSYLDKADRGLKFLINQKGSAQNKPWLAETLYRMGTTTTYRLNERNLSAIIQSQRRTNTYLIKAMEQNDPLWSARAAENLIKNYQDDWLFIESHWTQPEDLSIKNEKRRELHGLLTETLYRQPAEASLWNEHLKQYFDFAKTLDEKISATLFSTEETTRLTKEAVLLNDIKRAGRVNATQLLPEEKARPVPRSKKPKKDPNL